MNIQSKREKENFILKGILAGGVIGCISNISVLMSQYFFPLKILLFPIGLILICYCGLNLFTGNVYNLCKKEELKNKDKIFLLIINFLANLIGCLIIRLIIPINTNFIISNMNKSILFLICSGILCNMLVCLGVKNFQKSPLITYLSVFLFIGAGFEHSIADLYYVFCLPFNQLFTLKCFNFLYSVIIGNIIGGILLVHLEKRLGRKEKEK